MQEVKLEPPQLEVSINYRLPEAVMKGWLRGMDLNHRPLGFEPISGTVQCYSTQSITSLTNNLRKPDSR
jgi:hypothetical protein